MATSVHFRDVRRRVGEIQQAQLIGPPIPIAQVPVICEADIVLGDASATDDPRDVDCPACIWRLEGESLA